MSAASGGAASTQSSSTQTGPLSPLQQLLGPVTRPDAEVGYDKVLRGPGWSLPRSVIGVLLALAIAFLSLATWMFRWE